jgi:hypothetical protein
MHIQIRDWTHLSQKFTGGEILEDIRSYIHSYEGSWWNNAEINLKKATWIKWMKVFCRTMKQLIEQEEQIHKYLSIIWKKLQFLSCYSMENMVLCQNHWFQTTKPSAYFRNQESAFIFEIQAKHRLIVSYI